MICRMWHGWTRPENADAYQSYLQNELFPHVERDLSKHGYRGFHLLRLDRESEVEFVTMLWFESLANVKSFAGDNYTKPVIADKAKALLARYADRAEHYQLSASSWPGFSR
jgi:hypothetical protein